VQPPGAPAPGPRDDTVLYAQQKGTTRSVVRHHRPQHVPSLVFYYQPELCSVLAAAAAAAGAVAADHHQPVRRR